MRDIERSNNDGIEKNDTAAKKYYNRDADEKSVKGMKALNDLIKKLFSGRGKKREEKRSLVCNKKLIVNEA